MENSENEILDEASFARNPQINDFLLETAKWGKFLAIIGFVGMGIMILVSITMMLGFFNLSQMSDSKFPMSIFGLVYIIMAAAYYFPVNYLYQFSVKMKKGVLSHDQAIITSGFSNLKSLFKFMGIFTIVVLSLYLIIIVIAVPTMMFLNK
ncbi:MAG: hypothetical protein ACKVQB_11630 [Bacteroidia bacterium]